MTNMVLRQKTHLGRSIISKLGSFVLVAIMTMGAIADDEWKWTGASSADWNGAGNWLLNGGETQNVPNEWATVIFETAGEVTVNVPSGVLIASDAMNVKGGGTVTFSGPGEMRIHHFSVASSSVVFDIPVKLYNNNLHNWSFDKSNLQFKKPVTAEGSTESTFNVTLTDQNPTVGHSIVFEDVLTAPTFKMYTQLGWAGDSKDKVKMEFFGKTCLKTFKVGDNYKSGYFHFYAAGNEISVLSATYGQIFFHAANPLTESTALKWNDYWNDSTIPGRYDFAGDAVIDRIETTTKTSGAKRQVTASASSTLTLKATASVTTVATLGANLSFVYDPSESGLVQTFDANESAIDGSVTVKGGKVQLATTAKFARLKDLDIKSDAMFELVGTASGALASLQTLTVAGTFKVGANAASPIPVTCLADIAEGGVIETDVDLAFAGVTYKGQPIDFKTYETAEWLSPSSKGKVTVLPSGGVEATYTWTGDAGNGKFSDPGNWNAAPVFNSTRTTFVIPQETATISVDRKVVLKNLSFASTTAGTVTLTATDGAGFTFREGSIVCAVAASVAKSVELAVPVEFILSLDVSNGSTTDDKTASNALRFTGGLGSIGPGSMTRSGFGTVYITGDANAVYGDITANQGETIVSGLDPLGGSGTFLVNRSHKLSRIRMTGSTTITRDVRSVHTDTDEPFILVEGVDNVISGKITNKGGHARIWLANDAKLTCTGGIDVREGAYLCYQYDANGRQTMTVSGEPINGNGWFFADSEGSTLVLDVANNYVGSGDNVWYYAGRLETGVDQAIKDNQNYQMCGTGTPVLDVRATKQSFARLYRSASVDANGVFKPEVKNGYVTGTAGGSLKLTGSADVKVLPPFQDAVSFESAGTATRTMRRASSSSGTLTVSGGRLVLAAPGEVYNGVAQSATDFEGGAWTNGAVAVSGGTLVLNHAKALGKKQVLTVTGGALEVPSGVTALVGDLVVNGQSVGIGTYPTGSFDGLVTGGGAVCVRGLRPGLVLLVQ